MNMTNCQLTTLICNSIFVTSRATVSVIFRSPFAFTRATVAPNCTFVQIQIICMKVKRLRISAGICSQRRMRRLNSIGVKEKGRKWAVKRRRQCQWKRWKSLKSLLCLGRKMFAFSPRGKLAKTTTTGKQ